MTFDLVMPPEECTAVRARLGPYWDKEIADLRDNEGIPAPFKRQLVRAAQLERTSDLERVNLTCNAAGRYVAGADGRLVKK